MNAVGCGIGANTTADGIQVRGYSVTLPGWHDADGQEIWVKASTVDRRLGWKHLHQQLGSDRPRDANAIEAAARIARAYPHRPRTTAQLAPVTDPHGAV